MKDLKFWLVVTVMVVVGIVGFFAYMPSQSDPSTQVKISLFPLNFGEWKGVELPIDELSYKILETRNLFVREYTNAKEEKVYLYIVYSDDNRKVSHPPEICLQGGGQSISGGGGTLSISDKINATKLEVEKDGVRQVFVYWFKAGRIYTNSYLKQQGHVVIDRLLGKQTAGALIRVSAMVKGDDRESAVELVKRFSLEIEPLLQKYVP